MRGTEGATLYRHADVALLRAAAVPLHQAPERWPDPTDPAACRAWLAQVWTNAPIEGVVRLASSSLARRVDTILAEARVEPKRVLSATVAMVRYLVRATGRPTPFGRFAGVAPVALGGASEVCWGPRHREIARVDAEWLADVVEHLELRPEVLDGLDVVVNDLTVRRGEWLEVPRGPDRVTIRLTHPVAAVWEIAAVPIRVGVLAEKLTETFPAASRSAILGLLTELVRHGLLITSLRATFTIPDPLAHVLDQLIALGRPAVAAVLRDLESIADRLRHHNLGDTGDAERQCLRTRITEGMRALSAAGRTPVRVDLRLDCQLTLPTAVAREMERAASALLRLTPQPRGEPGWRAFHAAFVDRYGTGTLVPVREVVDADGGLGYPAGYPASAHPAPADAAHAERDARLLALAWQALADGCDEVLLTDEILDAITDEVGFDERHIPPHVELAARVHAPSREALDRGEFTLVVAPARAAGTLTSRFTPLATGTGLERVYRDVPTHIEDAMAVQLSFPPIYPHAQNVCRVPGYLPHRLPLGEHPADQPGTATVSVDDVAVTATADRLHLVSLARRRVIEPQVFHALALTKQAPTLARFLAQLPRGFAAAWYQFTWGQHAETLPYLPRVRYGRTVLSPARWRLAASDLPATGAEDRWPARLDRWRHRTRCPVLVELHDSDRTLRLCLDEPAHVHLLRSHLDRHRHAVLTEATPAEALGWIGGHMHEVALPLTTRSTPQPPPPWLASAPIVTNNGHGELPGAGGTRWLYAKIHTHRERLDELIAVYLPALLAEFDAEPVYWFVRYHSPQETDHLRLRVHTPTRGAYAPALSAVGAWCQRLRAEGVASRLVIDTYRPEIGRYGHGAALRAAERVFATDSVVVAAQLRRIPRTVTHPAAVAAANLTAIAQDFHNSFSAGMEWLIAHPAVPAPRIDRAVADQAITLATGGMAALPGWPGEVATAWTARAEALAAYRAVLPTGLDPGSVLESLLHMHHNRALGIDRDSEHACRRLARRAALSWRARPHAATL